MLIKVARLFFCHGAWQSGDETNQMIVEQKNAWYSRHVIIMTYVVTRKMDVPKRTSHEKLVQKNGIERDTELSEKTG